MLPPGVYPNDSADDNDGGGGDDGAGGWEGLMCVPGHIRVLPFVSVKSSTAHIVFTTTSGCGVVKGYFPSSR